MSPELERVREKLVWWDGYLKRSAEFLFHAGGDPGPLIEQARGMRIAIDVLDLADKYPHEG